MEVVKVAWTVAQGVLSTATTIYSLYKNAKYNKKMCNRLKVRVETLMEAVKKINKDADLSDGALKALQELPQTLENIASFIKNYGLSCWWKRLLRIHKIREDFEQYNGCLSEAVIDLSFLIKCEQKEKFEDLFDDYKWRKKNQDAMEESLEELKKCLKDKVADAVDNLGADVRQVMYNVQAVETKIQYCIQRCEDQKKLNTLGTVEISRCDLIFDEMLMETQSSILYRGKYYLAPVAIKRFKYPLTYDTTEVRENFQRDCKVMTKYNHANIVRIFGICVDFIDDRPSFCIVMEYCEKGTLREFLKKETNLSWDVRIDMCLGAARALFRLHTTTANPVVHQNVDSTKFLVDACYCVKMTGFELAQTESSLRRNPKDKHVDTPLAFSSPQKLKDINYRYTKACDIYSLGIVLWEIVTGKIPFQGLSLEELQQKVCSGFQQLLPDDCPQEMKDIINECRAYEPGQRPSAKVVANKLSAFVDRRTSLRSALGESP